MYKSIILLTILSLLIGCTQRQVEKKVKAKKRVVVDQNKTTKKDISTEEFIPEHIRLSHIEVVPH